MAAADRANANEAQDMRRAILDQASQLLTESGPEALTMRRLSQRIGASTIVLYTHFRDKPAILEELYLEGFERLRADLARVPETSDPLQYVMDLGRAYRRSAVANPTYYQIMFSRCVPGFEPSPQSREISKQSFLILADAVQRCMDAGAAPAGDAAQVAHTLWSTLHGLISLELYGYMPPSIGGEARLEHALTILRDGLCYPRHQEATR